MQEAQTSFNHCIVMDPSGHKVGTVSDVVSDATTLEPRWLVVDTGLLRASHYVPVNGSVRTEEGEIVVPFSKDTVHNSAKAQGDHVLTTSEEGALAQHYGLN
jgi:sporulation protein YlmC with PRC-barrel domain